MWVREWASGNIKPDAFTKYNQRVKLNCHKIPVGYFSAIDEVNKLVVLPMETAGYTIGDKEYIDNSVAKHFCIYLRSKGYDTTKFQTYWHSFLEPNRPDVKANMYPSELWGEFQRFTVNVWMQDPTKGTQYFKNKKNLKAIEVLKQIVASLPSPRPLLD